MGFNSLVSSLQSHGLDSDADSLLEGDDEEADLDKFHSDAMWHAVKELRNVPIVSVDFMLDNFLPTLCIDVQATKDSLKRVDTLSESGWRDLDDFTSARGDETDAAMFSPMEKIQNSIIAFTEFSDGVSRSPSLRMTTYPTFTPITRKIARTGPNACAQFLPEHAHYHRDAISEDSWLNTVYVEEYQTACSETNLKKNVQKLLWSFERLMNVDDRRRFAFGTTVEKTNMRFWFCCRHIIFATQPFDFMKEPDRYIKIISSLAYASPTQLGYDPNVELIREASYFTYRITVQGKNFDGQPDTKCYQVLGMLSAPPTKICGRGTRIYEAYDISDTSKRSVVLKDSWVDADRALEGDTLATILEGASEEERALFLTVLQHGVVIIDGQEDRTRESILRGYDISINHYFSLPTSRWQPRPGASPEAVKAFLPSAWEKKYFDPRHEMIYEAKILEVHPKPGRKPQPSRRYRPQIHYRLVFQEQGVSLRDMSSKCETKLSTFVTAICDTIQALGVMWRRRYVHRDISPGNIIMYNGRARLTDLEFAHQYGNGIKEYDHTRTGTYHFMSFEVLNKYCYKNLGFIVVPNPLHDMESIWWIGVWALFCHYSPNTALLDSAVVDHIDSVREIGETVFPDVPNPLSDMRMRADQVMEDCFSRYPWEGFTPPLQSFYHILEHLRAELCSRLKSSQAELPVDIAHFTDPDLHNNFLDLFTVLNSAAEDEDLWSMDAIWDKQEALLGG